VWRSLNGLLSAPYGWNLVTAHIAETRGHGWCRASEDDPLRLPFAAWEPALAEWVWENGRQPKDYRPYAKERDRWFRTSNDSALTQYGGDNHFQHGTIHPTYRAHIAFAEAVIGAMAAKAAAEPEPAPHPR
jgi:hypothetical protein